MLNCPIGLVGGTTGDATLTGCEGGTILWSSSSADLIVTPRPNGEAILTASLTASGVATVSAVCTIDGNSQTFDCEINLITPDEFEELECEVSEPLVASFVTCGERCDCGTIVLNFDCEIQSECDSVLITVEIKDCEQPDEEPCPPSTNIQLEPTINV